MDTETILPTHPETYGQLFKRSLRLYFASFLNAFLISLCLSLIVFIPRFLSHLIGQDIFTDTTALSPYRLWLLLVDLFGMIFFIALIWRIHCVNRGKHEPFIEDLSIGLKKVIYVFIATLIQSLVIAGIMLIILGVAILLSKYQLLSIEHPVRIVLTGLFFLGQFVLMLYVSTLFIFLVPLIAIENRGILASLERSVSLVWNHWWRVFSLQIMPWVCFIILLFILKYFFNLNIHIYFFEYKYHPVWITLLQCLLFAIFIPWVAALLLVQLKDLELRKHITEKELNALT